MSRTKLFWTALALAAGLAAAPATGAAQCRLCDTPTTERAADPKAEGVRLEVETSLDFDRLVLIGPGEGSATLRPDGSQSVEGTISAISGRAMVGRATVRGEPGRAVRIDLPNRIDLHSISGGRIAIDGIISDLPGAPQLDSNGNLSFRFGGRLRVVGDAEGDYRGDVPITVEYL